MIVLFNNNESKVYFVITSACMWSFISVLRHYFKNNPAELCVEVDWLWMIISRIWIFHEWDINIQTNVLPEFSTCFDKYRVLLNFSTNFLKHSAYVISFFCFLTNGEAFICYNALLHLLSEKEKVKNNILTSQSCVFETLVVLRKVYLKLFRGGWGRYSRLFGHKTATGCRSPSQI